MSVGKKQHILPLSSFVVLIHAFVKLTEYQICPISHGYLEIQKPKNCIYFIEDLSYYKGKLIFLVLKLYISSPNHAALRYFSITFCNIIY